MFRSSLAALFALVLSMHQIAWAAVQEIALKGSEHLLISVPDAVINFQATVGAKNLRINLIDVAQEDFSIQTQGDQILIQAKNTDKESFGKLTPGKKHIIEISGRALPVEVHAFEAQVQLTHWSKEALIHIQKGRLNSKDGAGTLKAHLQNGDISILDHQGLVSLDTYKGNVLIKNLSGDLAIENFAGETNIEKARGFLSFNQGLGGTKILGSSGSLQFEVSKGNFSVQNFLGRVEGQTIEAPVSVQMANDTEIHLKSKSGKIIVSVAPTSGALLNITSQEGDVFGPSYLKVSREANQKSLRGRLKGEIQKGSIVIRSQEGAINIR